MNEIPHGRTAFDYHLTLAIILILQFWSESPGLSHWQNFAELLHETDMQTSWNA